MCPLDDTPKKPASSRSRSKSSKSSSTGSAKSNPTTKSTPAKPAQAKASTTKPAKKTAARPATGSEGNGSKKTARAAGSRTTAAKPVPGAELETTSSNTAVALQERPTHVSTSQFKTYEEVLLTDFDLHLFSSGNHYEMYRKFGAHPVVKDGVAGTYFAVWAPNARHVNVMGDFNNWDRHSHALTSVGDAGVWQGFVPGVQPGDLYKYFIESQYNGYSVEKFDPCGFAAEMRPSTASMVWDLSQYEWQDQDWMAERHKHNGMESPVSIYEMHVGSWMRVPEDGNRWLHYEELADKLVKYLDDMGYTHVEFLPMTEYPFDGSWGYQTVGYYAPTSRYGSPDQFKFLIDKLHQAGIGVLLDWVPAHFPRDAHGLGYFDGTHLYEHADARLGEHKDWGTFIFNYGRHEVRNFLISSAMFWFDEYHIDGIRVDAVASMLYLNYSREDGEWIPNEYGGNENLAAIDFLRRLNERIYEIHPDTMTIAEESTAWPQVSRPTYLGGLGFGYKWDMGWMHDTLSYMSKEAIHRKYHQNQLTFRQLYSFSENFVLPLSHDEVVHGKGSILARMAGDDWQRFANIRALYGYMWSQPGKKLLFMGQDMAQSDEWNYDVSLPWHLLEYDSHRGVQQWVKDLNHLYKNEPAMHVKDTDPSGFWWVDCNDAENSIFISIRESGDPKDRLLIALNFTPVPRENYMVGVPTPGVWKEILNSDAPCYWGSGLGNFGGVEAAPINRHGQPYALPLTLPPLSMVVFKADPTEV